MRFQTILNKAYYFKYFVFTKDRFSKDGQSVEVTIEPRKNSRPICSVCGSFGAVYDTDRRPRRFESVPLIFASDIRFSVFFIYKMRRVKCVVCRGVRTECVPWGEGKHHLTRCAMLFLADWGRHLSWKEVSERFGVSWQKVFYSVKWVVEWGLKHRDLQEVTGIGVDEIQWKKGHKYLTLVYQINAECVRLLWVGKDRTEASFHQFFDMMGDKSLDIKYVCSDMWKPYLKVIKERIGYAVHILDRFHIVARLNKALDEIRAKEHKRMKESGYEPLLTKARWLLLKRNENLTKQQDLKLKSLVQYNLMSVRGYLLKEDFQQLWSYVSVFWAGGFIDRWTKRVMRSRLEPLKKEAKTIRKHKNLILNYFRTKKRFSSGIVEGLNNKIKVVTRKSYGFKSWKAMEIALYHSMGKLPEPPKINHTFL